MLKIAVQNSQFVSKGQTIFYEKAVFGDGWALFSRFFLPQIAFEGQIALLAYKKIHNFAIRYLKP